MRRDGISQGCPEGSQWDTMYLEVKAKPEVLRSPSGRKKSRVVWPSRTPEGVKVSGWGRGEGAVRFNKTETEH